MFKLPHKCPHLTSSTSVGPSKKQESSRKTSTSALLTTSKPLTVWITTNCGKFFKRWGYQITLPASWEICMQVKKQHLEPNIEQRTGSKLGNEYVKAVYCHSAYLTSMQSTSWETVTLNVWITINWKILKEMGIPDHLSCLLRKLYAGQEATVRTGHGTTDWFQIGKRVRQGCILSPCLFNFYAEYIMRNAGLEEAQAGIKIAGRNISNLRYADDTTLWQKVKRN